MGAMRQTEELFLHFTLVSYFMIQDLIVFENLSSYMNNTISELSNLISFNNKRCINNNLSYSKRSLKELEKNQNCIK